MESMNIVFIYEDDLPKSITDAQYAEWFKQSRIVDGVRMGPTLESMKMEKKQAQSYSFRIAPSGDGLIEPVDNGNWFPRVSYERIERQRDELWEALGEAITQAQADALKLRGSVHGRKLQALADKWTEVFNRAIPKVEAK